MLGADLLWEVSFFWVINEGTGISEFCIFRSIANPTNPGESHVPYQEDTRFLYFLPTGVVSMCGAELWSVAQTIEEVVVVI